LGWKRLALWGGAAVVARAGPRETKFAQARELKQQHAEENVGQASQKATPCYNYTPKPTQEQREFQFVD
jgi:hypothetical protein